MNPNMLEEELSSGPSCDNFLIECENGHLRELIAEIPTLDDCVPYNHNSTTQI